VSLEILEMEYLKRVRFDNLKQLKEEMLRFYSSRMVNKLFKIVKREGLPEDFISRRCANCLYNKKLLYDSVECFKVLCPYIGKGYIKKKRRELCV